MPGVYSTRFFLAKGVGPFTYVVPSGKRAIVKQMTGANAASTAVQAVLQINDITVWILSIPVNLTGHQEGLQLVVNAGETLKLFGTDPGVIASVHGYLLDL